MRIKLLFAILFLYLNMTEASVPQIATFGVVSEHMSRPVNDIRMVLKEAVSAIGHLKTAKLRQLSELCEVVIENNFLWGKENICDENFGANLKELFQLTSNAEIKKTQVFGKLSLNLKNIFTSKAPFKFSPFGYIKPYEYNSVFIENDFDSYSILSISAILEDMKTVLNSDGSLKKMQISALALLVSEYTTLSLLDRFGVWISPAQNWQEGAKIFDNNWIDSHNFVWKCEDKEKFSNTAVGWIKYQQHIFKNSVKTSDGRQLFIDIEGSKGFFDEEDRKFWYLKI